MRVLLGLGQAQVRDAGIGPDVREDARQVARGECDGQAEVAFVLGEADEVGPRRLRPREVRERRFRQGAGELTGAVGAEVEEDDGVAVANRPDGLALLDDDRRLEELVGLVPGVGGLDGLRGARGVEARREHERLVGPRHAIPALVAIHRVVAPRDARDPAAPLRQGLLQAFEVAARGAGRRVAAVGEGVHADARHAGARGELEEALEMPLVRVHAAVREQAHQVERRAARLRLPDRLRESRVLEERPVAQGEVDPKKVLRDHPAGAERQVPDLGVAHHAGRQSDGFAGGLEQRPRILGEPAVVDRRARPGDGVALGRRRMAPAVADQKQDRTVLQAGGAGRRGAGCGLGARVGRGRRRSRSETTCMYAM